jgi:hypothetical protein
MAGDEGIVEGTWGMKFQTDQSWGIIEYRRIGSAFMVQFTISSDVKQTHNKNAEHRLM